jgi:hypothetical protein
LQADPQGLGAFRELAPDRVVVGGLACCSPAGLCRPEADLRVDGERAAVGRFLDLFRRS